MNGRKMEPENPGMRRENRGIPLNQRAQSHELRKGHRWNCLIGLACTIHHPDGEGCSTNTMQCTCGQESYKKAQPSMGEKMQVINDGQRDT